MLFFDTPTLSLGYPSFLMTLYNSHVKSLNGTTEHVIVYLLCVPIVVIGINSSEK